ncbi:hypothetical protein E2C01_045203 [Portunus trituberculatus]|uniref:Uncharacterized protein n=1 Tax=Portunus trituberculatus TaxID=210409 RepID=A0A5B7G1F9_PORTR|nr:hypothetical protein [Portunus trituberculatus]
MCEASVWLAQMKCCVCSPHVWGTTVKRGSDVTVVSGVGYACRLSCWETRRGEMEEDLVSNAEENVEAASMRRDALPVSEEDAVSPSISRAASSVPNKLDQIMQWMSEQMKKKSQQIKEQSQEMKEQSQQLR